MPSAAFRQTFVVALIAFAIPAPAAACDGWDVTFRTGSFTLSATEKRSLSRFVTEIGRLERSDAPYGVRPYRYRVTGQGDSSGAAAGNLLLSRKRAETVR